MAGKRRVLISVGSVNFSDDVAATLAPVADLEFVTGDYSNRLGEASAVVVGGERVNEGYLAKAPKLGIVARFGVGYDAVDVEACTRRRIYIGYTPDILSTAVADLTWALILSWMRRIPEGDIFTRTEWGKRRAAFPFGWDLAGKTVGFLGLGRIGAEAAKRGRGFDVKMIYHDVVRRADLEAQYGIEPVGFQDLLRRSDVISVHLPLLPATAKMLGAKEFRQMKRSALLVNTSRGGVIDQAALAEALELRLIAGAALDVYEEEPIALDDKLLKAPNLIATPHCASATWETRRRMAERCAENVRVYLEGRRPPFVVPEQSGQTF
ncbi:MAG TPA: D-glycerate dehydrogenase [Candidatus Sulfotelmatobacter sp.]|nr:D-glycerate dehydrogenase [Candidatus Sulfotelmatobacter sp.]